MAAPRLICILGAECTGKTTLAQALAQHFDGLWVPEYLRDFCRLHGRTPQQDEQALVLQGQLAAEHTAVEQARRSGSSHVFCDTAALLTAVYSAHYFADHRLFTLAHSLHARYHLTLLLAPDLPWVADGLQREGAYAQTAVHSLLVQALHARHPVTHIAGDGEARLQAAVLAISTLTAPQP